MKARPFSPTPPTLDVARRLLRATRFASWSRRGTLLRGTHIQLIAVEAQLKSTKDVQALDLPRRVATLDDGAGNREAV